MRCKGCKKRRKLNKDGFCSECQARIYLQAMYILGELLSNPRWVKAFCGETRAIGKAMKGAMQALQGDKDAE